MRISAIISILFAYLIFGTFSNIYATNIDSLKNQTTFDWHPKEVLIATGLITSGLILNISEHNDLFFPKRSNIEKQETPLDDMVQYSPIPALFVFDAFAKEKNNLLDQAIVMSIAYGLTALEVQLIKHNYNSIRPDGAPNSFPSGHTACAFVGAHIIYREFKDTNKYLAYSGYAIGALTAGLRIFHNRHWVCDVLAGAGLGILSAEISYMMYFPLKNYFSQKSGKNASANTSVYPAVYPDGYGLNFAYYF
ncbi:MAG: phosphatase PAP2 family protein [Dysgonamonadaceae bacterium]|jgi:hypothetical protein|nr:phosphatase PAP2 family protein [Dysgonamonadaceae bacterium]